MYPLKMEAHEKEVERKAVMHERTKHSTQDDYTVYTHEDNEEQKEPIKNDLYL